MSMQRSYERLMRFCCNPAADTFSRGFELEGMILDHVDEEVPNEALLAHLAATALSMRGRPPARSSQGIYERRFDLPQTTLFYLMAGAVPFVFAAHSVANRHHLARVGHRREVTLVDIGIGKGLQVRRWLRCIGAAPTRLRRVVVAGVDPVAENLETTERLLASLKGQLPFEVEWLPMNDAVERLTPTDLERIKDVGGDDILINSAFTLHHTFRSGDGGRARTDLLRRLAALDPLLLTIIEPSSNHVTADLADRFLSCWRHFGCLFELVDESSLAPEHRLLVKERFFGREIFDILGADDARRCERHETYRSWLRRLEAAGFELSEHVETRPTMPAYCDSDATGGLTKLRYGGSTVVAVIACERSASGVDEESTPWDTARDTTASPSPVQLSTDSPRQAST